MSLISFIGKVISDFRGAWFLNDQVQQSAQRASLCHNMRFLPSKVFTRPGLEELYTLGTGAIRTFYNQIIIFLGLEYSRIVYLEGADQVKWYYLDDGGLLGPNPRDLYTQACAGLSIAEAETRLYIGHFLANGGATGVVKIINSLLSGIPADDAFPDPPSPVVLTITDVGPGFVSAGEHLFCIRVITRSGFPGKPTGETAFTVAPGGREIRVSFTTPAMQDSQIVQLGMTTVDNQFQFWDVPEALTFYLPGSTSGAINASISDEQLVTLPETSDLTDKFNLLTGGLAASKVVAFGNRNVYIVGNKAYISDPYNLQWILDPDNVVQVEGQRHLITAQPLGGSLVLFGPGYTFSLGGDNNRKPREWAPPVQASKEIGTQCVNGACAAAGHQFLWVADESGLYVFNGAYGEIPVSYMFDRDWQRINWAAARAYLQMEDNATERCLYINVPLDDSEECNYRMVIDYSRARTQGGVDPYKVDYTLDRYNNAQATPSIGRVLNSTTKKRELCIGLPDGVLLRNVPGLRTDRDLAIASLYETGLVLSNSERGTFESRFGGMQVQVKGSGQLAITPYGLGQELTSDDPVGSIELQAEPDGEEEARWHMMSENESIRMETTGIGEWFELSRLKVFFKRGGSTKAA